MDRFMELDQFRLNGMAGILGFVGSSNLTPSEVHGDGWPHNRNGNKTAQTDSSALEKGKSIVGRMRLS